MNKRLTAIDALKGFAIILVIVGHTIFWTNPFNYDRYLIFKLVYTFHVPLFFFISGYLVYNRFGPTTLTWIINKLKVLIKPYILYSLVYFYIRPGFSLNQITLKSFIDNMFSYVKPDSAWFLPVLFESFVILSLIINIERKVNRTLFIPFFILFLVIFPSVQINSIPGVFQVVYYTPYLILGYYLGKINIIERIYDDNTYNNSIFILGVLLFPIVFSFKLMSFFNNTIFMIFSLKLMNLLLLYYSYFTAITGIIFSICIIKLILKSKIFSLICICGVYSLELYLIHLLIGFYSSLLNIPFWFGSGILEEVSGILIILTLSLSIAYILSKNEKISKYLFGRWSAKHATKKNKNQVVYILAFIIGCLYILNILLKYFN